MCVCVCVSSRSLCGGWADVGLWVAVCFLSKISLHRSTCKTTFALLTQSQAISQSFRVFISFRSMRDTTFFHFSKLFLIQTQWFSRHPFVCAVCYSKPRVFWMEIRRSRMSAFLTSYAHAFCTVTWRDLVLHVRKNRKRRSLLYRELYPFQKFAIPLENLQFHWSMYPYERGSVSTVVCHLFVVRVPERSAVCSQALCAVSGEA